jgi:hypothetical protein
MDYEVERCTRHCAVSERELREGEEFYSVLVTERGEVRRHDYAPEAWPGPPDGAIAWWKSRLPTRDAKKRELAPNEVLLELFRGLESVPQRLDMRYVLALLLVRRRVLREEDTEHDPAGQETLVLYCPRDETLHHVIVTMPDERRSEEIQAELALLLSCGVAADQAAANQTAANQTAANQAAANQAAADENVPESTELHQGELA